MDSKKSLTFLGTIVCLGLLLRLYGLDRDSLWLDEATSITVSRYRLSEIVQNRAGDTHPPFYYFLLHYWIQWWGDSEFATRLLSVIFGVAAILVIYRIGVVLWDAKVGLYSALVLALAEFHIHYSQEVKGYSLLVLLVLVSFYFFIRLHTTQKPAVILGYLLSSALLMYTHVYGLFTITSQNLYVLLSTFVFARARHVSLTTWLPLQVVLFLMYLPWMGIFLTQVQTVQSGFWIPQPSVGDLWSTLSSYAGSDLSLCLFIGVLVVAFRVHRGAAKESLRETTSESGLLSMWLTIPILLPFLLSFVSAPVYLTRCTIGASVAFYLFVGKGLAELDRVRLLQWGAVAAVCLFSVVNVWQYHHKIHREQWRDVVRYIEHHAHAGDMLLFHSGYVQKPFNYYLHRTDLVRKSFPGEDGPVNPENVAALQSVVQGYETVWFILSHGHDDEKLIQKTLSDGYTLLDTRRYVGIEIFRYSARRNEQSQVKPLTKG